MANENIFFDLACLAFLGDRAIIGKTVRIRKPDRCRIGARSIIDDFTYISCGIEVGAYTHIGANSVLIGGDARITIGHFVNIAPGCRLIAASNDFSGGGLVGPTIPAEFAAGSITEHISIGDHVLLGTNTVILPGTLVPEGVSTGALTLLTPKMKLEPWTLYAGSPARKIRTRASSDILATSERLRAAHPGHFTTG